jgi:hypothetical protein
LIWKQSVGLITVIDFWAFLCDGIVSYIWGITQTNQNLTCFCKGSGRMQISTSSVESSRRTRLFLAGTVACPTSRVGLCADLLPRQGGRNLSGFPGLLDKLWRESRNVLLKKLDARPHLHGGRLCAGMTEKTPLPLKYLNI